jgi:hypothetical protein|tara:strand:+ start:1407 stop:1784 length:378 start_codon:yes stop_codon:yes gene_type:complete
MKNGNLSTTQLKARVAQAIVPVVALEAGQQLLCHALLLESQCHHCIGTGQSLFKTAFNCDRSALSDGIARQPWRWGINKRSKLLRQQTARPTQHHIRATTSQCPKIGAGDAGMQDVSNNHDFFTV